jgi:serine/threonine-protein kinase
MDAVEKLGASTDEGRRLGKYHLIAELARGGMGVVFLALVRGPSGFNKLFVVKELRAHLAEDPELVSMFLEEARLAAKLNHRNIVQTIEVDSDGRRHFIAMEYLDGQSYGTVLARLRQSGEKFPLAGHLYVLSHVLEGLQYAHAPAEPGAWKPSIVHRDMSPQNVLLTIDGQVKIIDFGIAKAQESPSHTRSGVLKGKLAYMAPEQAASDPLDGRSDIFSVGVMLWEAAVGARMWNKAGSDMRILQSLTSGTVPRPADEKPDLDPDLERMILKATAPKANDRYQSAAEFQADIENHLRWLAEPAFGAREIQKLLSGAFAGERASMKALIDAQLRSTNETTPGADSARRQVASRSPDVPATPRLPTFEQAAQTIRAPVEELATFPSGSGRDAPRGNVRRRGTIAMIAVAAAGAVAIASSFTLSRSAEKRGDPATLASSQQAPSGASTPAPPLSAAPGPSSATSVEATTAAAPKPERAPGPVEWPARRRRGASSPAAPAAAITDRGAPAPSTGASSTTAPPRSEATPVEARAPERPTTPEPPTPPSSPPPASSGRAKKSIDTQDPYAE